MRTKVNETCNVVTGEDSHSPRGLPQITVPHLRLRLYPAEAAALAGALLEAVERAQALSAEPPWPAAETCDFCGKPAEELGEVEGKLMCVPCFNRKGEEMIRKLQAASADLKAGGDPGKYFAPPPDAGLSVRIKAAGERGEWAPVAS